MLRVCPCVLCQNSPITDAELEQFWKDYIGDSGRIVSSALNQIFVKGPFGGHSVRQVMGACVHRLGKALPVEVSDEDW